ncbi:MAG: L,D-transpeptidase [Bacteroidota bacterium]
MNTHHATFHLRVLLPKNRNHTGWLRLEKGGKPVAEYRCLGRGSRGGGDTSMLEKGNTPTGLYNGSQLVNTQAWSRRSYGRWGAVRLKPIGGNALTAQQIFGRNGLLIHGGAAGSKKYWRGKGALRATHGCLRLSNQDMKKLMGHLLAGSIGQHSCQEVSILVSVAE